MHFIEHIIEPMKLLMTWRQSLDNLDRTRYVVAELNRADGNVSLKYLVNSDDFQKAKQLGFEGYPAFQDTNKIHDVGVLDALMRRLPPRTRGDFQEYLEGFRIKPNAKFSDFALLGYTAAKLPSDRFAIINPFDRVNGQIEFLLEAAGYRFMNTPGAEINIDDLARFQEESQIINGKLENTIKIFVNDLHIGYVTRALLPTFHEWIANKRISKACVEKKNGNPGQPVIYHSPLKMRKLVQ